MSQTLIFVFFLRLVSLHFTGIWHSEGRSCLSRPDYISGASFLVAARLDVNLLHSRMALSVCHPISRLATLPNSHTTQSHRYVSRSFNSHASVPHSLRPPLASFSSLHDNSCLSPARLGVALSQSRMVLFTSRYLGLLPSIPMTTT